MKFENRLKKELSEAVVKACLVDAGYRVVAAGIEYLVREAECLTESEFYKLGFSKVLTKLPDFIVMNKQQTEMHCIDVKYRSTWSTSIFDEVEEQTKLLGKLTLVCINANPQNTSGEPSGGTHLRCCELKIQNNVFIINRYKNSAFSWVPVSELKTDPDPWFRLAPMQYVFHQLIPNNGVQESIFKSIMAIRNLMESF